MEWSNYAQYCNMGSALPNEWYSVLSWTMSFKHSHLDQDFLSEIFASSAKRNSSTSIIVVESKSKTCNTTVWRNALHIWWTPDFVDSCLTGWTNFVGDRSRLLSRSASLVWLMDGTGLLENLLWTSYRVPSFSNIYSKSQSVRNSIMYVFLHFRNIVWFITAQYKNNRSLSRYNIFVWHMDKTRTRSGSDLSQKMLIERAPAQRVIVTPASITCERVSMFLSKLNVH